MKTTLFNRLTAGLLAAVLCLSVLAGCAAKPQKELTRYSTIFYDVFDTVTQVIAYCESEEEFTKQMEALHADLISYNQLYDIYNDYDGVVNVKTINDNAGKAPVQVDDRILSMLELAQKMYDTTNGKLNVAMGSVLNIWHNYREAALADDNDSNNQLPTQEELDAAAQHCDIANLIIDEDAKTVYLADPAMSLDVGSVGKGYAVEQAAQAAEARGLTSALVSVGGNIRAIGTNLITTADKIVLKLLLSVNRNFKTIFIALHQSVHKQNKKSSSCLGVTKGRMEKSLKKSVIKR